MGSASSHYQLMQEFTEHADKNIDYYDGTRFFKVSNSLYPNFTRGWFYGWYETDIIDYSKDDP